MKNKELNDEMIDELYDVILKLKSKEDCKILFDDLCTYIEINQMASRIRAAKMLMEGQTYNQIIESTDISSATLSRVSKCINRGSGGYEKFVDYNKKD